jgi:hypothetical protein
VIKRGDAIAREMNRQLADDKKMSKKEKDERILCACYSAKTFGKFKMIKSPEKEKRKNIFRNKFGKRSKNRKTAFFYKKEKFIFSYYNSKYIRKKFTFNHFNSKYNLNNLGGRRTKWQTRRRPFSPSSTTTCSSTRS